MSNTVEALLVVVLVLATSIWLGGYVAIAVVARSALQVLDPSARVAFFRSLGRKYFWVGTPALVVALAVGVVLARNTTSDGLAITCIAVAATLVACFVIAVFQARRMTRLREAMLADPTDASREAAVVKGNRIAQSLRGSLGILSFALLILGAFLTVH